jgi:DNA-directed RNA polymerase I, II, and III subunit RPABC5
MIIPIRCMNCGNPIANLWRYYQKKVREGRGAGTSSTAPTPTYIDGTTIPDTVENKVLNELNCNRYCCRKHFLTNVDLIDNI